jgi:hypothetical protein
MSGAEFPLSIKNNTAGYRLNKKSSENKVAAL